MSKLLITAATVATLLAAPVFASDNKCNSPAQDQWMTTEALTAMYAEKGYTVKNIKIEDGCYEVYGIDAKGARVEIIVDPMTGEAVGTEDKG